jgi:hypothetical protein
MSEEKFEPHYCLVITYENQNYSSLLICLDDSLHEIELAKLRYFKDQLHCETVESVISAVECGYSIHVKKIKNSKNINLIKEYINLYFDSEYPDCAVLCDEFKTEPYPEEREKMIEKINKLMCL